MHKNTLNVDVFYSTYNNPDTVLFHALESLMVYYPHKIERLFVPKLYNDRNTRNFLKELKICWKI